MSFVELDVISVGGWITGNKNERRGRNETNEKQEQSSSGR